MNQQHEIKKNKDNEVVKEFNSRFEKVLDKIPKDFKPKDLVILLYYTNAFKGPFGFQLRDKAPTTFKNAQETAKQMEQNFSTIAKN